MAGSRVADRHDVPGQLGNELKRVDDLDVGGAEMKILAFGAAQAIRESLRLPQGA